MNRKLPADAPAFTPAEFIAALAKRGVAMKTDGARVWPDAKGALTVEEDRYATAHNASLVALLTTKETTDAAQSRP